MKECQQKYDQTNKKIACHVSVFACRLFYLTPADMNLVTCMWDEGGDRCEVHQCVVVRVEAVVEPNEAFG